MSRIAFTADLHVDAYGQRVDPATGLNARLLDYLTTLRWVAQEARGRSCDLLVVAGDFTERRHVNEWLIRHIQDALSDGPKRQLFIRGNHDAQVAGESIVTVLEEMSPDWHGHSRAGLNLLDDVVICSIGFVDRHWLRTRPEFADVPESQIYGALAEEFLTLARSLYAQAKAGYPERAAVLVCHQTLAGAHLSEAQQAFLGDQQLVVNAAELAAIGYEGIVAGHLHRHQVLSTEPPVLYPGSIERVDFGEEHETKGFIVADVGPGRFEWEFVETPARRFVTLTAADEALPAPPIRDSIVRAVDLPPSTDLVQLRQALEERGAFEVASLTHRPVEGPLISGGLSESLTPEDALSAYFEGDADREELVSQARRILEAVR